MDYSLLGPSELNKIGRQKLLELEAEHARLDLDLRLAHATGIDNDNVTAATNQLAILVQQIATLTSWLTPAPIAEPSDVSANGDQPVAVE